jgi:hypothetical protein
MADNQLPDIDVTPFSFSQEMHTDTCIDKTKEILAKKG